MANKTPSIDWVRRTTALSGSEDLLRQNPIGDASPFPKEERIPINLIKDYTLTFLPDDKYIASGAIVGNNLVLTLTDASTVSINISSALTNTTLVTGVYNSGTKALDLTLSDATIVSIPVASLIAVSTDNTINGDGNTTALSVVPSTTAGNQLTIDGTDGKLYVAASENSGATNLTNTPAATTVTVASSTGTSTILVGATTSLAGVMTAADKVKLTGLPTTIDGSETILTAGTNVTITGTGTISTPYVINAAGGGGGGDDWGTQVVVSNNTMVGDGTTLNQLGVDTTVIAELSVVTPTIILADNLSMAMGIATNADDLGTFTGSIITNNATVKGAMQELETAIETVPTYKWYTTIDKISLYATANPTTWISQVLIGEYTITVPIGQSLDRIAYLSEIGINRESGTNETIFHINTSATANTNTNMQNSFTPSIWMSPTQTGGVVPVGIGGSPSVNAPAPSAGIRDITLQGITNISEGITRIQINDISVKV